MKGYVLNFLVVLYKAHFSRAVAEKIVSDWVGFVFVCVAVPVVLFLMSKRFVFLNFETTVYGVVFRMSKRFDVLLDLILAEVEHRYFELPLELTLELTLRNKMYVGWKCIPNGFFTRALKRF